MDKWESANQQQLHPPHPTPSKGILDLVTGVEDWKPRGRAGHCTRQGLNMLNKPTHGP